LKALGGYLKHVLEIDIIIEYDLEIPRKVCSKRKRFFYPYHSAGNQN